MQEEVKEIQEYMTPIERILGLVMRKRLDRIPVFPFVTAAAAQLLHVDYAKYCMDPEIFIRCQLEAQRFFGYDAVTSIADLCIEAQGFGAKIIFPTNNAAYPDPHNPVIKSGDGYKNIEKLFSWDKATRMKNQLYTIEAIKEKNPDIMIGGATIGPMGLLSRLRNVNELVRDFVRNKDKLHEALDTITNLQIEFVEKQIEAGARTIMVPVVLAERELMSKEMWEELDAPYQQRIARFVRRKRALYCCHTCGRGPYFDLLIKWLKPIIIQNAFLPDGCSTETEMLEKYGNKLIFLGFLSVSLLAWASPSEVFEEGKRQLGVFGKAPAGYLFGASCEYPPYAPLYNAIAVVKAARTYGANYKPGEGPQPEYITAGG
jgi:uroporphyrinogen decarboxylase